MALAMKEGYKKLGDLHHGGSTDSSFAFVVCFSCVKTFEKRYNQALPAKIQRDFADNAQQAS
jgi:hypothetical protein